jgi:hypothetical protein
MEDEIMRELRMEELALVSGGRDNHQVCTEGNAFNDIGGISNSGNFGSDLINIYEGAVAAMSHMIERVADALKN